MLPFKGNEFEYIAVGVYILLGLYWFYILYKGVSYYDKK